MVPALQYPSLIALAALTYFFGCDALRYRNGPLAVIFFLGWLYPLGKVLQFWLIGPAFVRGYLADIGWVSCIGLFLTFTGLVRGRNLASALDRSMTYSFLAGLIMEINQLYLYPPVTGVSTTPRAAGDWVDALIFCVMYAVNRYLIQRMKLSLAPAR